MMARFSPTVLPDDQRRERPDLEIAQAFDEFRTAQGEEEDRRFTREDRGIAAEERGIEAEERGRRRSREDIDDAAQQIEFERFVKEQLGGTPTAGAPARPEAGPDPRQLFQDARLGLAGKAQAEARERAADEPPQLAVLPGQFAGGAFSATAVYTGGRTRELAGQTFDIDPTQTAAARGSRASQADFDRKVQRLIDQGDEPARARAAVEFGTGEDFAQPEEAEEFDPTRGEFENPEAREAFLQFKRELSVASEAGRSGRERAARAGKADVDTKGPITEKDALAELDQMYGEFDESGILVGSQLSVRERQRLAQMWAAGELEPEDLPEKEEPAAEEELPEQGPGLARRAFRGVRDFFRGDSGAETQRAGVVEPSAVGAGQPGADTAMDSIRLILRDIPHLSPDSARSILLDEGFMEEDITQVLRRR